MIIGVPAEIKAHEYRVAATPNDVSAYCGGGHAVLVQRGAGERAGYADDAYRVAGASVVADAAAVYAGAEMIVKVKEPQPAEHPLLREGQLLFAFLHLAADAELTAALLARGVRSVAYETIERDGHRPCLVPMSEIAGRLAVQEGARHLSSQLGGRGVLLGGVPGVPRGRVAIIGGGVVGLNAAKVAVGMGAEVTVLDRDARRLAHLDDLFGGRVSTLHSTAANIESALVSSDLVIGAVLVSGARAPRLIVREQLRLMRPGSVIVDVAVDQGGCVETTRPTTHDQPTYEVDGVIHYCVANMPGSVARTATMALTGATLPYGLELACHGAAGAARRSSEIAAGINTYDGRLTCRGAAEAFDLPSADVVSLV